MIKDYIYFIDDEHKKTFESFLLSDETHKKDYERMALLYLLGSTSGLRANIEMLYDFKEHCIKIESFKEHNFYSSGENKIIELAYNLYNGYGEKTPTDLFCNMDYRYFHVMLYAIIIRYNKFDEPLTKDFLKKIKEKKHEQI